MLDEQEINTLPGWSMWRTVILSTIMILAITEGVVAQDSLITKGKLLVHVSSPLDAYYNAIANDTTDLSTQAQQEFDWLRAQGGNRVEKMATFSTSRLGKYFVIYFDSSMILDTMLARLSKNTLIDTVVVVVERTDELYGCHENAYAEEYMNDPSYNSSNIWHVWSADQYIDTDMSVTDAWEFTRSDASVVTLVDAGGRWWICEEDQPKTIWRDFGSQIIEGWWPEYLEDKSVIPHIWTQEPPENCWCYDCDDWQGSINFKSTNMMITDHVYRTCSIIAGQFDTTTNGSLGIAPLSKIIPVSYDNNLTLMQAVDFGIEFGAKTIIISSGRHYKDSDLYRAGWEYAYDYAVEQGVLPILAVGNDNKDPLEDVTTPETLNVAGNVGPYRSSITSYDAYPYVNISAAGYHTSFAAAAAAGVAALVQSRWPEKTASELKDHLLDSADPMLDPIWDANLNNTKLGVGRLNAYKAIATKVEGEITEDETWSGPIYVTGDVIVKPGVTLTIDLTPVDNLENRTQVRFASLTFAKPPQILQPKIIVQGSLVVSGTQNNKILFSGLQRNMQVSDNWFSLWGGIKVQRGASIQMEHAVIEGCDIGIIVATHDAVLNDVEFCNVARAIIVQNYDSQYGEPVISSCKIHNAASDLFYDNAAGLGIGVWRGKPQITGCDISNVNVGVHYFSSFAKGTLGGNYIHDTWSHGVLCVNDCAPTIVDNRIDENEGYGVSLMFTRKGIYLKNNVISNNGRKGLALSPPARTADGLFMYNATARLHANTIDSNRNGVHLESFSSLIGGDGTVGPYGSFGVNTFAENDTTILGNDHSKAVLGIYSGEHHYGHGNTMDGKTGGMQAVANAASNLWLQCNTWNQSDVNYFYVGLNPPSRLFRFPISGNCEPIGHPYPDDQFESAQEFLAQDAFVEALQIYASLAETAVDSIVLRAVGGFVDVYAADSLHQHTVAIDTMLDYAAYCNRNASDADGVKANIAYAQAILATELNDYDKADSCFQYAKDHLQSSGQLRNNLSANMYLELYKQADTTAAFTILEQIESQFATDPLISVAQDLFRYYVDIEMGRYIRKRQSAIDARGKEENVVPDGLHLGQNYPNPFSGSTIIPYSVETTGNVQIVVRNIMGRTVKVLRDSYQAAGTYRLDFDASLLPGGVYICVLRTDAGSKMIMMSVVN